tara:strand:+ start:4999 stop:5757 length:759 start_codon:yes stop_codon:yes gene_type:complete
MDKLQNYKQFNESNNIGKFEYNDMIDYTLLDNNASDQEIRDLCEKAIRFGTKSVCVMPKHVKLSAELLKNHKVLVCTVVDFPGGHKDEEYKAMLTKKVIHHGADEVDMVLNYNSLIEDHNTSGLIDEVKSLVTICHGKLNKNNEDVVLKVIVESGLLTEEQTESATEICLAGGSDFIKTSTGKVGVGAELDKVRIMKSVISNNGSDMQIKVSGGVRTLEQIEEYGEIGATRFGMGYGSVDTLNGLQSKNEGY